MTAITISTTDSAEQVVSGIPRFVTITTNISAVIFYTLDNTVPTLNSTIYVGPIQLPTNILTLTLQVFATDGTDTSPVFTFTYETDTLGQGARTSHSGTNAPPNATQGLQELFPYGSGAIVPGQVFLGAAEAGFTTDNPILPQYPTGFDGSGNPDGYVNVPLIGLPTINQPILFTETDAQGNRGVGIGNLPKSTVQKPVPPPEQTDYNSQLFDPRAMVVFQDFTGPNDPSKPVEVNRQFYSESNESNVRQGALYFNSTDTPAPSGTFIKQHFNPADQTLTYYYYNSQNNKLIISKTAFTPAPNPFGYGNVVFSGGHAGGGAGMVFQWIPFKANYLY